MIGLRYSNVIDPAEYGEFPSFEDDPASRKWNRWSYIDSRDGAQAVVRALAYDQPGFDNFIIANADTVMSRPRPSSWPSPSRRRRSAACSTGPSHSAPSRGRAGSSGGSHGTPGGTMPPRDLDIMSDTLDRRVR